MGALVPLTRSGLPPLLSNQTVRAGFPHTAYGWLFDSTLANDAHPGATYFASGAALGSTGLAVKRRSVTPTSFWAS